jgi:ubiquitin carboxyl-terminal hydrolase 9/24
MAPYTSEGIQERERTDSPGVDVTTATTSKNRNSLTLKSTRMSSSNYELVGVVVHSGQASAGHYYSFIKERTRSEDRSGRNRWLKFNDTTVEEFDMNDTTLEAECFGGTYKAKSYDTSNSCFVLEINLFPHRLSFLCHPTPFLYIPFLLIFLNNFMSYYL